MTLKECLESKTVDNVSIKSNSPNLIVYPYVFSETTINGITIKTNSDGSVNVFGTATNKASVVLKTLTLETNKQYTLSGYSSGQDVILEIIDSSSAQSVEVTIANQTKSFMASYSSYDIKLSVETGKTVNATFYPQLEVGIVATNYSLNTGDKEVEKVVYGSRNLFPKTSSVSSTITGVTFTNNGDGTIKANGTATANSTFNLGQFSPPKGKELVLSGCPIGGSTSTYYMYIYDSVANKTYADQGNGISFIAQNDVTVYIRIANGVKVENLLFKPQIEFGSKKTDYVPYNRVTVWSKI